ncbi:peptidoglycan bridge formation glycyltransferase FemA/FemB family protein [Nordella sp. HKS 07]|uniref:lipid II:glycine glycyltransferase FemX n=1 Tax=Nordella sp. HKS 07 TaxID=2712222 RepID=UPI0013E201CA|nr:GNAT family N-acetyltransferase [Nordella sp. HKS 07]QIG50781.1 peptidoglycan bridge formation glycyltransferase FemA/FemB family protein [Nordella sp. HKS 07]
MRQQPTAVFDTSSAISGAGIGSGFTVEVDNISDSDWDGIASGFADIHPEQTACFAGHHWKGRDSHLLLHRNGEPVAGARVALVKLPLIGRGLAFLRFGPFWRRRDAAADPEIYRAMIAALVEEYCVARGHCLTVLPRPHPRYHAEECGWLRDMGFAQRRQYEDPERYVVNTALNEGAQLKSLAQKWRYNLRQALANSLDVRMTEAPEDIDAFQKLYVSMMERKDFSSTTPVHLTGQLIANLPDKLKPKLFVAYHEKKLVAGATVGLFGDTAYYMFGASSADALPLKAGYALHWVIVQWLNQNGFQWYDLGGASHEPGLRQFKKGFVGKAGQIVTMEGEFDRWTTPVGRLASDAIFGARNLRRRLRHGAKFGKTADSSK